MKRQRLAVFVFWASLVLLVVCSSLAVNRPRRVSTGIPGEAVSLGMGVDEVLRAAGTPDWAYSESGWRRGICVFSYHREVLGRPATVSYTFNDRRESKNAWVTEASVRMEFDTRAECDRAMEALAGITESGCAASRASMNTPAMARCGPGTRPSCCKPAPSPAPGAASSSPGRPAGCG